MSIISFIEERKVIDKIIHHLKLSFQAERPPPPQVIRQELLMAVEDMGIISDCLCGGFLSVKEADLS